MNNQDPAGELLLREVDEDLRRELILRLWRRHGKLVIAALLAIILGVAGHQLWQGWRDRQFREQAAAYAAALDLIKAGKSSEGLTRLAQIAGGKDGFAVAAGFRRADLQLDANDSAGAVTTLQALAQSEAPPLLRDLATLKAAMLSLDHEDPEMLSKTLLPLATPDNPWRFTATELLAVLAGRRGDTPGEISRYQQLADDVAAPQAIRARAAEMLSVLGVTPANLGKPQKG